MNLGDILNKKISAEMPAALAFAILQAIRGYVEKTEDCGCFTCKLKGFAANETGHRFMSLLKNSELTQDEIDFVSNKMGLSKDSNTNNDKAPSSVEELRKALNNAEKDERYEDAIKIKKQLEGLINDIKNESHD